MSVTQENAEAALHYLAETDVAYAEAKAQVERTTILCKRVRARITHGATGSVEHKKAEAEISLEAGEADDAYIESVREFETLRAKRQRAELTIDVWRSINSAMKRGNI